MTAAEDFERLGAFYLGRAHDVASGRTDEAPLLYDARDLTTHAVCVGMTGSGKTGLCIALLEEAAIDGVPALVIDPKGDMGNLLLGFPDLEAKSFEPWIDPGEARRAGSTPAEHAAAVAIASSSTVRPLRLAEPASIQGSKSSGSSSGKLSSRLPMSPLGSITRAGSPSIAASSSRSTARPVLPEPVIPTITAWVVRSLAS
jgi:hypothetical protein